MSTTSAYAKARLPTALFNTPIFDFKKDDKGHLRSLETIAFPGTKFSVVKERDYPILEVTTCEYVADTPLYVDCRLLEFLKDPSAAERQKVLPSLKKILGWMESKVGTRYLWGGNWAEGVPEMAQLYPHLKHDDDLLLKGLDCSGLLYQATHGFTCRNTSQLCDYGIQLEVDLDSAESIQKVVKPLDLMVWKGHVVVVFNSSCFIESTEEKGVFFSDFKTRYHYYRKKLKNENKTFTFRRWYPNFLS